MNSIDSTITDERLSAYLDGMLDEDGAQALEQALHDNPGSARRLARMIRNDRLLRQRFQAAARRPVPESISALLEPAPEPSGSWLRNLGSALSGWTAWPLPQQVAGAVAFAAVFGIATLTFLDRTPWSDAETLPALAQALPSTNADLAQVLDSHPSGQPVVLEAGALAQVELSFRHADGRYCRQYRVAPAGQPSAIAAVACRSGESWREVFMQRVDAPADDSEVFRAAGGRSSSLLDDYILENMTGDIMVGETEAALIQHGWSEP